MTKSLRKYRITGIVYVNTTPNDIDSLIEAYSERQALLKLAFKMKEDIYKGESIKILYNLIKKSRLHVKSE